MSVCTEVDYLYALKKIDDRFFLYDLEKDDYNKKSTQFLDKIEKIETWLARAASFIKELKKNENLLNLKCKDYGNKILKFDEKILSVKNNKEYQALIKEKEGYQNKIEEKEEELFDIMEKSEKCFNEVERMTQKKIDTNAEFIKYKDAQKLIFSHNKEDALKLKPLREKVVLKIKKRNYESYEAKKKKIKKAPVFELNGGNCPFCGFEISQSLKNGVTTLDGINCCNECGVILYWPGASEARVCSGCNRFIDTDDLISAILDDKLLVCSKCQHEMSIL